MEEEEAAGRTIGETLEDYATARDLDLLVMGAYGHSRIRDFVLGGATKTIVANPPLPVLLSH
jgi:nucleotide-binding universal stress UspA family protein